MKNNPTNFKFISRGNESKTTKNYEALVNVCSLHSNNKHWISQITNPPVSAKFSLAARSIYSVYFLSKRFLLVYYFNIHHYWFILIIISYLFTLFLFVFFLFLNKSTLPNRQTSIPPRLHPTVRTIRLAARLLALRSARIEAVATSKRSQKGVVKKLSGFKGYKLYRIMYTHRFC